MRSKTLGSMVIILVFIISCGTNDKDLMKRKIVYDTVIHKNYSSLGGCIKDTFPPVQINRQSTYMANIGSSFATATSQGIQSREDIEGKTYYINHFFGSENQEWAVKYWLITVKGIGNNKSEVKIRGRKNIVGKLAFSLPDLKEKINQCI